MKRKFRLSDKEVAAMKRRGIAVPSSLAEVKQLLKEGEESGTPVPFDEAVKEINRRLNKRWGKTTDA
jgi:hypothetical protein